MLHMRQLMLRQAAGGGGVGGGGAAYLIWDATAITGKSDGASLTHADIIDQSGNGRNPTGWGSAGANITYAANGFGTGIPGIRFAGSSHFDFATPSLTEADIFLVIKVDSDPPASAGNIIYRLGTHANDAVFPWNDGIIYDDAASTTQQTVGNPSPSLTTARLYNVISSSSEWTANLDTTQLFTTATNTVAWDALCSLGGQVTGGFVHSGFFGYIGYFAIYPTKRTPTQRAAIAAALKTKFSLTGY